MIINIEVSDVTELTMFGIARIILNTRMADTITVHHNSFFPGDPEIFTPAEFTDFLHNVLRTVHKQAEDGWDYCYWYPDPIHTLVWKLCY